MADWKMIGDTTFDQDIDATSTTQEAPLGAIVKARDIDNTGYGDAEFIYGVGVASTIVGSLVLIDGSGYTTTLTTADAKGKCGVAMSANVASQYGWYAIHGTVLIDSGTVADGGVLCIDGTSAGQVDDDAAAGDMIYGAFSVAASSGGTVLASITYPYVTDNSN